MERYSVHDGCFGIVVDSISAGVFIELDNGEIAFSYQYGNLPVGSKIICTVLKDETSTRHKLVTVDTVCIYGEAA